MPGVRPFGHSSGFELVSYQTWLTLLAARGKDSNRMLHEYGVVDARKLKTAV